MKILKIKLFQPRTNYRIPSAYQTRLSYLVPPYSTVIGFLCSATKIPVDYFQNASMGIYTKIGGEVYETVLFDSWRKGEDAPFKVPVKVEHLLNVEVLIYLSLKEDAIDFLLQRFENPDPFYLGSADNSALIEAIEIVEKPELNYFSVLEYNAFMPHPEKVDPQYLTSNYERLYEAVPYSCFRISSLYRVLNGQRVFERIPVKQVLAGFEQVGLRYEVYTDPSENIPLFMAKLC